MLIRKILPLVEMDPRRPWKVIQTELVINQYQQELYVSNRRVDAEVYLYKMAPVARIQIAPPLKYLKLCLSHLDLVSGT
jgi:hypothetical protein